MSTALNRKERKARETLFYAAIAGDAKALREWRLGYLQAHAESLNEEAGEDHMHVDEEKCESEAYHSGRFYGRFLPDHFFGRE